MARCWRLNVLQSACLPVKLRPLTLPEEACWPGTYFLQAMLQGFRHWRPADPNNPDPVNTGVLVFDNNTSFRLGSGALCIPFCKAGQMAYDGNQNVYITVYDQAKGQPLSATFPGVWRVSVSPQGAQLAQLRAPKFGLAGNLPTSIALGPDGNLYVGFLKNGNGQRGRSGAGSDVWAQR